ncbi:hypothetical protein EDC01DRAFT_753492 [Geopyxis carbonaria]|nr:hypothetical protein EDC01DRAFT_753492 [Geopyxis carbonaria]
MAERDATAVLYREQEREREMGREQAEGMQETQFDMFELMVHHSSNSSSSGQDSFRPGEQTGSQFRSPQLREHQQQQGHGGPSEAGRPASSATVGTGRSQSFDDGRVLGRAIGFDGRAESHDEYSVRNGSTAGSTDTPHLHDCSSSSGSSSRYEHHQRRPSSPSATGAGPNVRTSVSPPSASHAPPPSSTPSSSHAGLGRGYNPGADQHARSRAAAWPRLVRAAWTKTPASSGELQHVAQSLGCYKAVSDQPATGDAEELDCGDRRRPTDTTTTPTDTHTHTHTDIGTDTGTGTGSTDDIETTPTADGGSNSQQEPAHVLLNERTPGLHTPHNHLYNNNNSNNNTYHPDPNSSYIPHAHSSHNLSSLTPSNSLSNPRSFQHCSSVPDFRAHRPYHTRRSSNPALNLPLNTPGPSPRPPLRFSSSTSNLALAATATTPVPPAAAPSLAQRRLLRRRKSRDLSAVRKSLVSESQPQSEFGAAFDPRRMDDVLHRQPLMEHLIACTTSADGDMALLAATTNVDVPRYAALTTAAEGARTEYAAMGLSTENLHGGYAYHHEGLSPARSHSISSLHAASIAESPNEHYTLHHRSSDPGVFDNALSLRQHSFSSSQDSLSSPWSAPAFTSPQEDHCMTDGSPPLDSTWWDTKARPQPLDDPTPWSVRPDAPYHPFNDGSGEYVFVRQPPSPLHAPMKLDDAVPSPPESPGFCFSAQPTPTLGYPPTPSLAQSHFAYTPSCASIPPTPPSRPPSSNTTAPAIAAAAAALAATHHTSAKHHAKKPSAASRRKASNSSMRASAKLHAQHAHHAAGAEEVAFVNFTPNDASRILSGVAPSGSSKTKARREREALEKRRKLSEAAAAAVIAAGGDASSLAGVDLL